MSAAGGGLDVMLEHLNAHEPLAREDSCQASLSFWTLTSLVTSKVTEIF